MLPNWHKPLTFGGAVCAVIILLGILHRISYWEGFAAMVAIGIIEAWKEGSDGR